MDCHGLCTFLSLFSVELEGKVKRGGGGLERYLDLGFGMEMNSRQGCCSGYCKNVYFCYGGDVQNTWDTNI